MMPLERAIDEKVRKHLESLPEKDGALIPLLQRVQLDQGFISPAAVEAVAGVLGVSESKVYGVATFYSEFKLQRPGKHQIKVCMGTACYLRGSQSLLEHLIRRLSIIPGRTTKDEKYSLETVACLGCCSRSPVIAIDQVIHGGVSIDQAEAKLSQLDEEP